MTQRSGVHALLEIPLVYIFVQKIFSHRETVNEWNLLLGNLNNKNVLDIGCGPGREAPKFIGANYTGIDISKIYIDEANKKYSQFGKFYCCSIDKINELSLSDIDIIVLKGVLHHLNNEQINSFLFKIQSTIGKKSRILTMDPVITKDQSRLSRFFVSLDRGLNVRDMDEYYKLIVKPYSLRNAIVVKQKFPSYQRLIMEIEKN